MRQTGSTKKLNCDVVSIKASTKSIGNSELRWSLSAVLNWAHIDISTVTRCRLILRHGSSSPYKGKSERIVVPILPAPGEMNASVLEGVKGDIGNTPKTYITVTIQFYSILILKINTVTFSSEPMLPIIKWTKFISFLLQTSWTFHRIFP